MAQFPITQKVIDIFSKFPTVGKRTAGRFVFYLIKLPQAEFDNFINSLKKLKNSTRTCSFCFNPFETEDEKTLCPICENPAKDKTIICIIEKEADLNAIENTKKYNGLYFIFGEATAMLKNSDNPRTNELEERIKDPKKFGQNSEISEVIIATNSTYEGESTGLFIERKLKSLELPYSLKITHLAKGLPTGGELEYADEETISSAFEGRK